MFSKTWLIIVLVNCISNYSYGQRDEKFFRYDYTYVEKSEAFYKIHALQKSWYNAKQLCALEGATLFYPETSDEANALLSFWNDTQPFNWAYIGISDIVVKGVFETLHGQPADMYYKWGPGEPNDAGGVEDCAVLKRDGTLYDVKCQNKSPFICKKSLYSLEWNQQCNMPNLDYLYNSELGRCYKFHTIPRNWTDAYTACNAERSYLAVINTQLEADNFVRLTETNTKNKLCGQLTTEAVHLGFHNRLNEGWQTVKGTLLDDSGYAKWGANQPDGQGAEQCGSMSYNGLLNDISCDTKSYFICVHEVVLGSTSGNPILGGKTF